MPAPVMTPFETKVFMRFVRNWKPPYAAHSIQLEGDGQIAVLAAAHRLIEKDLLARHASCRWYLTKFGEEVATEIKAQTAQKASST